jgi:hypothetical protein
MNDTQKELRAHYKSLLANIVVKDVAIPVINLARIAQKLPYILVFGGTNESADTRTTTNANTSITVQVHVDFAGNYGGEEFADDIVNEILEKRYTTRGIYGETTNWKIVTCTHVVNESARIDTNTSVQIIKSITFNHFLNKI